MTTYVEDSEGKFIPASQRPDGTWRKARRVKDGYIPQEEVPLYESKGKLFAKKPTLPVGMCPSVAQALKDQRLKKEQTKQQTSNAKVSTVAASSKQNRIPGLINIKPNKQEQSNNDKTSNSSSSSTSSNSVETKKVQQKSKESTKVKSDTNTTTTSVNDLTEMLASTNFDPQTELAKKLKKLRKKIREIEQIEGKMKSGELKNPEKDQIDKVGRKPSILKELDDLEKLVTIDMIIPNQTNGSINN